MQTLIKPNLQASPEDRESQYFIAKEQRRLLLIACQKNVNYIFFYLGTGIVVG